MQIIWNNLLERTDFERHLRYDSIKKNFLFSQIGPGQNENVDKRRIFVENTNKSMILALFSLHPFSILMHFNDSTSEKSFVNLSK